MKSQAEIEDLRNTFGAVIDLTAKREDLIDPSIVTLLTAVHNALCHVLDDGTRHQQQFVFNYERLLEWCAENGIVIVKLQPPTDLVQ